MDESSFLLKVENYLPSAVLKKHWTAVIVKNSLFETFI